ncbi:unnamed protein product, partial [Mycena citricolor]
KRHAVTMVAPLPPYPPAAVQKALSPAQLSTIRHNILAAVSATTALPASKRDTPATRTFIETYAKEQARAALDGLIWEAPISSDDRLIRKRVLALAATLPESLDLRTLIDLAIIYSRSNRTAMCDILDRGLRKISLSVESELLPALTSLLVVSEGLYVLRKTAYCVEAFLRVCPKDVLRFFRRSKEFVVSLATAYDAGLSSLAHSYGGLDMSDTREMDEWERIWIATKVSLVDAFHIILRSQLDDMAASEGAVLALEADRTFNIIFALLELPSGSQSQSTTPFLDQSLLADYQQTYNLSKTLAAALRNAAEKDVRLDLLESTLQSYGDPGQGNAGALKLILRSSGVPPGVDNLGKSRSEGKGKGKAPAPAPVLPEEDPQLQRNIAQVLDILPEQSPDYVRALLLHSSYSEPEKVIDALFEGTAPPMDQLTRREDDDLATYVRSNVFDEEEMDADRLRVGKKTEDETNVLRDRSFIDRMKAEILRRAEEISDEEDEDEEPATQVAKGKKKEVDDGEELDSHSAQVKVGGDGEESGDEDDAQDSDDERPTEKLAPETVCELAYIRDPKLFDRDAATRRSKARADLQKQTGWSHEQLEGWRTMLERDPKKDKILAKHEFAGNQNRIPEAMLQPQSSRNSHSGGRGRGRGAPGRGSAPNADGSARERAWKDKNKASRGNHNRKRGHDKKMARAGPAL